MRPWSSRPISRRRGSAARRTRARCACSRSRTSRRSSRPRGRGSWGRGGTFAEAVGQVARAASRDEARPVLTGVLLEVSREGVTLVATDSYRLAVRDLVATAAGEAKAIVPERALSEAGRAAQAVEKGEIEVFVDESQVVVPGRGAHPHVAADRGRVPELPAAPARGVREPPHGVAAAADRRRPPGRAARPRQLARCGWSSTRSGSSSRRPRPTSGRRSRPWRRATRART